MQNKTGYHYLHFTKKERNGIICLLLTVIVIAVIPAVYPALHKADVQEIPPDVKQGIAVIQSKPVKKYNKYDSSVWTSSRQQYANYEEQGDGRLNTAVFYFDPNTLSESGWKKLGVKDKTVQTIMRYISKGGRFRKPADIEKIWGIPEKLATRLIPYVQIADEKKMNREFNNSGYQPAKRKMTPVNVDINESDTSAWMALPGIGPKLSQRIVQFRNRLGGFYSISQVAETYGLADSVFQKIKPMLTLKAIEVKQININVATKEELKEHPYIRYNLANLIVQYRSQHGPFSSVKDLLNIMAIDQAVLDKLSAYLIVH